MRITCCGSHACWGILGRRGMCASGCDWLLVLAGSNSSLLGVFLNRPLSSLRRLRRRKKRPLLGATVLLAVSFHSGRGGQERTGIRTVFLGLELLTTDFDGVPSDAVAAIHHLHRHPPAGFLPLRAEG